MQLERAVDLRLPFLQRQLALHQQPARTAARVVDFLALLGLHQIGDEPADFLRREEFAGALALAFGELPQKIFIGPTEEVRLHVSSPSR